MVLKICLQDFSGYSSGLGWNPFIRVWCAVDHNGGDIEYWKIITLDGTITDTGTEQFELEIQLHPMKQIVLDHSLITCNK